MPVGETPLKTARDDGANAAPMIGATMPVDGGWAAH
jgi:hypothetical protein